MCTDTQRDLYRVCLLMTLFLRGKFQNTRKSFTHSTPVFKKHIPTLWAGQRSRYSDWLRAGRSGDRIPVRTRFSAPVQTSPGAHPASCTMGTGPFQGVKSGQGVTLTHHPLLVQWPRKGRAIPLLPLRAVRPVQSLSACTRVHFTLPYLTLPL
jgi:hypothetical protein